MVSRFMSWLRRWRLRMGLVRTMKKLSDFEQIPIDDEAYQRIEEWKAIYQGYYEKWHLVKYNTIDGPKTRKMATLKIGKVLANEMASLIFNEKCEINISDEKLQKFIDEVFKDNNFYRKFQEYLEYMFGLSGIVIKPYHSDGKIKLSYITADCFIPTAWDNQGIYEGVFLNQTVKGNKRYTLLEWHSWEGKEYVIRNQLFESDLNSGGEIGKEVPLSTLYEDLEEEVRINNFKRSNFVYFKPNLANNFDTSSPLGISIFANALDTLHSLDVAFDSFQREFRLGKKRIIVPASAVRAVADEHGNLVRYFDANDEVYQAMELSDLDEFKIHDNSVELRVEEHVAAINALLNILAMQTGFSAGTFSFDGKSMKTATEVVSENSKTFKTKQSHEIIIESGIQELIECIVQTAELYGVFEAPSEWETIVKFDDSIAQDANAEIDKEVKKVANGLQSRRRAIMKVQGVSEEEAMKILQEIIEEERMMENREPTIDDSVMFGGME